MIGKPQCTSRMSLAAPTWTWGDWLADKCNVLVTVSADIKQEQAPRRFGADIQREQAPRPAHAMGPPERTVLPNRG